MRRKILMLVTALAVLLIPCEAKQKPAQSLKRAAAIDSYPVRHPLATLKGLGALVVLHVGAAVDVVERGTAALHYAVSEVDKVLDKIEGQVGAPPAPAPAPSSPVSRSLASRSLAIPGCANHAQAFVPSGCYGQIVENHAEVRCAGETFIFSCITSP